MKFQLLDTEKFKQTIPYPPRNYWDFPVVGLTFCESLSFALRNLDARIENCELVPWDKARDEKATQDYLADWAGEKGDGVFDPDRMVEAVLGELPPPGPCLPHYIIGKGQARGRECN